MADKDESVFETLHAKRTVRKDDLSQQEIDDLKRSLSVRERLERKLLTDVIEVTMKDDLGEFKLKFRKFSPKEHDRFVQLQGGRSGANKEKQTELNEELFQLLERKSLDDLDANYWREGTGYSPDVLTAALMHVLKDSVFPDSKYMEEIKKSSGQ